MDGRPEARRGVSSTLAKSAPDLLGNTREKKACRYDCQDFKEPWGGNIDTSIVYEQYTMLTISRRDEKRHKLDLFREY